ncbi:hypothetical protein M3Y99_00785200 [Aphelenchoides fujianensis]|nr:hypothetical protein M3Y99_00785200 [Aphelenchoides fujianensis]
MQRRKTTRGMRLTSDGNSNSSFFLLPLLQTNNSKRAMSGHHGHHNEHGHHDSHGHEHGHNEHGHEHGLLSHVAHVIAPHHDSHHEPHHDSHHHDSHHH